MHILLLDQRLGDRPCPELETLAGTLSVDGVRVSICCPIVGEPEQGLARADHAWPIQLDLRPGSGHLHDWNGFLQRVGSGAHTLSAAAAELADVPLGLLREAVRRAVTTAVDESDVDVIFVSQAGLLVEFAIETGPPVAAHADGRDLAVLKRAGRLREIVAASLSSCELLAADGGATADHLGSDWIEHDPERPIETWPLAGSAERIVAACRTALERRFTP